MALHSLSRRQFLSASVLAGTAAASGCLGLGGRSADGGELHFHLGEPASTLRDRFVDDPDDTRPSWDERAYIDGDVENDAGVDDMRRRFLRYDGTYHPYWLYLRSGGGDG